MGETSLPVLQGTLDMLILKALVAEARHGYGVAEWIRETTADALNIEEGALYVALHRMERRKWLESRWGLSENNRRAKYYTLTAAGRKELVRGAETWSRYAEAVSRVLSAGGAVA